MSKKKRFQPPRAVSLLKQQQEQTPPVQQSIDPGEQLSQIPEVASEAPEETSNSAPVIVNINEYEVTIPPNVVSMHLPFDINVKVGHCQKHFSFRCNNRQALALDIVRQSLANRAERFQVPGALHEDGKVVDKGVDALRWLLDQIADAAGLPT